MNNDRRKKIEEIRANIEAANADLDALRDEERDAFEGMPDSLRESEQGQASEAAADALDEACDSLTSAIESLDTAAE